MPCPIVLPRGGGGSLLDTRDVSILSRGVPTNRDEVVWKGPSGILLLGKIRVDMNASLFITRAVPSRCTFPDDFTANF